MPAVPQVTRAELSPQTQPAEFRPVNDEQAAPDQRCIVPVPGVNMPICSTPAARALSTTGTMEP